MRAHRPVVALLASIGMILALCATPTLAGPPERVEEPIFIIFPDPDNNVVVFWNVTREAFCAWEEGGFVGDPPATQSVTGIYNATPKGPIVFHWSAKRAIELWTLDADADFSGPCQDTDNSTEPWATGVVHARNNDNDLDHGTSIDAGLHRTNSFGDRGTGVVRDAEGGAWHYAWHIRIIFDADGDVRVASEQTALHPR